MRLTKKVFLTNLSAIAIIFGMAFGIVLTGDRTLKVVEGIYYNRFIPLDQLRKIQLIYREIEYRMVGVSADIVAPIGSGEHLKNSISEIKELWKEAYSKLPENILSKEKEAFQKGNTKFIKLSQNFLEAYYDENIDEVKDLYDEWLDIKPLIFKSIDRIVVSQKRIVDTVYKKENSNIKIWNTMAVMISAGAVIFFIVIAVIINRTFSKKINRLSQNFKELSKGRGDLTKELKDISNDEVGEISLSFNDFIKTLNHIIFSIKTIAQGLLKLSGEVDSIAGDLRSSAVEHASNCEEILTSLEQISGNIAQNSENSSLTNELAGNTSKLTVEGSKAVSETVDAMKEITEMVTMIEDIAYQTNLLSLNAAIEAARAGGYGKSFAVVAGEVKKLAEKSRITSLKINELVSSSVGIAERAGMLLNKMVPDIMKISELINDITISAEEEDKGVSQINIGMSQINEVSQHSAATSEKLANTARELNTAAKKLHEMLDLFTVKEPDDSEFAGSYLPES